MEQEVGICRLSVAPMRLEPSEKSEMVSQTLFGEHYEVIERHTSKQWVRIRNYYDGYEGWLSANQHYPVAREYFEHINKSDYKISLDVSTTILYKKYYIHILLGSVLPLAANELFKMEEQLAFNGQAKSLGQRWNFEQLKEVAYKYLNAPYLWGGKTPFGIDCSGLTQMTYRICGYSLKRDASDQIRQGIKIESFSEAQPGDLIFCANTLSGSRHVGILLEDNKIIHASGRVRVDRATEEGIVNDETEAVTHSLTGIRRILK